MKSNEFYFTRLPSGESSPATAVWRHDGQEYPFTTDKGVFSRAEIDYGSYLLAESLPPLCGSVLDMGCGYGFIGIAAMLMNPGTSLTMCDVNLRALSLTGQNLAHYKLEASVTESDGFSAFEGATYSHILTNPPISAGKAVYMGILKGAASHLAPGGSLIFVMHKKHGALSAARELESCYREVALLRRDAGYHVFMASV